ncbi:hypothetical protein FQN57_001592 [Myotisia sp. PD_48]|nr:hypothetical protein FQN57_001592 [Myotisia sp. PD_48]
MSNPLPPRSPFNKANSNIDYSYTSPLRVDGSDYPCKKYHTDPFNTTAQYTAGQEYEITLAGSATHGGGSCQISLSYDAGASFKVIKSMIGGCPLKQTYKFTIPSDAPAGQALLAWSWFNCIGNREMYMNCAHVTVSGLKTRSGWGLDSSLEGGRNAEKYVARRELAFDERPAIFIANVSPSQCKTTAGEEVVFPFPGPDVEYGAGGAQGNKGNGKGYICSGGIPEPSAPKLPSSSSLNEGVPSSTATVLATEPPISKTSSTEEPTHSAGPSVQPTTNRPEGGTVICSCSMSFVLPSLPTKMTRAKVCSPGSIKCDSGKSLSLCVGEKRGYIPIGKLPSGYHCEGNVIHLVENEYQLTDMS